MSAIETNPMRNLWTYPYRLTHALHLPIVLHRQMTARGRFEDLPAELFYQIQSYLNGTDLFAAFSNLNSYFDRLLSSATNLHFEVRQSSAEQRLATASFASCISVLIVPHDTDAVAIATSFANVRSIIFHQSIRVLPSTLPLVQHIQLDLSAMRLKRAAPLLSTIASDSFPRLCSFHLRHRKPNAVGHWTPLLNSFQQPCLTLTAFTFDIRPTTDWEMLERLLQRMPHLQQLTVRTLNTRALWTLQQIARTLGACTPQLTRLHLRIHSLGVRTPLTVDTSSHSLHPLFQRIESSSRNPRKPFTTTVISSYPHKQ